MNVLIDSVAGDAMALGLRLKGEGHEVAIAIESSNSQRVGEGLLDHVDDPVAHARDEDVDLVLYDMVGRGGVADALHDLGVPVLGGARALDLLELDRIAGLHTFRALGLTIPDTQVFEDVDFDRAIAFVQQDKGRWVFKPSGNVATDKTFIGEDVEELVDFIEHERDRARSEDVKYPAFVLQRFVEGVEVSCERWYSHGRPVTALDNATFEEKKFLAGNLGPAAGCMGNVVLTPTPKLTALTVAHLDRWALAHRITGPIDLNTIIDAKGRPYILEATARFGYDALWAFLARWQSPIGETLIALAEGESPAVRITQAVGAAVHVAVPPFPFHDAKSAQNHPLVDDVLDDEMIWPVDVMETDEGDLVITGSDASAYVVTATGATPADAYGRCYAWLQDARLPDRMYRNDLLDRVQEQLPSLRRLQYFP